MTRELLERVSLFVVPFAMYAIYLVLLRARSTTPQHRHPWAGLFIAGLVLVVGSFIYTGLTEGESTKGVYVPPQTVNGKVVPGHVDQTKTP
ncbi:MAG TPA: DUF6111 family protein [Rhizomicrobium sp.]|jgi:hypothetical protein|nr:DUF6111 family protein [Rhizomicrobium sp.]